ncbi:MAG: bifunctional DNA-formamidopyrimidine glycosylase/DNA-(apurinic or apyrimidinic site) lyase [Myxococcaceae bacterium]|nr:bifunctional DNA-formamidopyrimidine glycosylase/DNA-(apurinic or apyrimidinic site) lyase [Myxococcaceae bacterium]
MPELPEVEIARRSLQTWLKGHEVVRAHAEPVRVFRGAERRDFEKVTGKLMKADRRGKYLMLQFSSGEGALCHLGMTGKFVRRPAGQAEPYSRAQWVLETGEVIHFKDPRMFGRIEPAPNGEVGRLRAIAALGIDPLVDGLEWQQLKDAVGKSKTPLKVALMDQSRVAGLGNIHAAEALFRAGLHPARKPGTLDDAEWKKLTQAIHKSLAFALQAQEGDDEIHYVEEPGTKNPFLIYGRAGKPCQRCKTKVQSMTQGGRTSHFCSHCQPLKPKKGTHR